MLHTENCVNYICVGLVCCLLRPQTRVARLTLHTSTHRSLWECVSSFQKFNLMPRTRTWISTESSIRQSVNWILLNAIATEKTDKLFPFGFPKIHLGCDDMKMRMSGGNMV